MAYIGPSIETGFRQRYVYTATSGQTSFSGNDSVGISLTYTDSEYLDVYQNGVLLVPGSDYAATTGTTVVLVTGASLNDKVEMIAYQAFGVADTVSRADGGAFGGAVSMASTLTVTGNVGIGNARTDGTLHVHTGSAGTVAASAQADDLVVENSGEGGITIATPDASSARIRFTSPSTNTEVGGATIFYRQNINKMNVGTAVSGGKLDLVSGEGESAILADGSGNVTMAKQPVFQVKNASAQSNISINTGTTIAFGTEIIDIGANFASNTFTAPVTGSYLLGLKLTTQTVDSAADYYRVRLATANRNYDFYIDPDFGQDPALWTFHITMVADMDASDTAQGNFYQAGGTAQTDLKDGECQFFGYLIA